MLYARGSTRTWRIVKNTKIFWSYVKHFPILVGIWNWRILIGLCKYIFINPPIIFLNWDNKVKLVPASFSCFINLSWKGKQTTLFTVSTVTIKCSKFWESCAIVLMSHRVFARPKLFNVGFSWVQSFFSWLFCGSKIFSRGFFVGPKFFLIGFCVGAKFFLVVISWVQNYFWWVFRGS